MEERESLVQAAIAGTQNADEARERLYDIAIEIADLYEEGRIYVFDSPVEEVMYGALIEAMNDFGYRVIPQYEIGCYRADFAVFADDVKIAVECDGFAYHDATKEKATKDKQRERRLIISGFTVVRFSASEVMENAPACASEVLRCIRTLKRKEVS